MRWTAICGGLFCLLFSPLLAAQDGGVLSERNTRGGRLLVQSARPTYAESALFNRPGEMQVEGSYLATSHEDEGLLHTMQVGASMSVADLVEVRLRWDLLNLQSAEIGVGDVTAGIKGGFFGGLGESTALAGLFEIRFPSGSEHFGLNNGVGLMAGGVITQMYNGIQFDIQAGLYTHAFQTDPTLEMPLALGVTWIPWRELRVFGDFVESLNLVNLSHSTTSVLAGAGWAINRQLIVDASFRLGLSRDLPDVQLGTGVTWLMGGFY